MPSREQTERLTRPATPLERLAAAAFGSLERGLGRQDVLVVGALDGGLLARRAAVGRARVLVLEPDVARLRAAAAAAPGLAIDWRPAAWGALAEACDPGAFDLVLGPWLLAREADLEAPLRALARVLRTDGLLAAGALHPSFCGLQPGALFASAPAPARLAGAEDVTLHHHPLGAVSEAMRAAGFVPSSWREVAAEAPLPACLVVEAGKEKW